MFSRKADRSQHKKKPPRTLLHASDLIDHIFTSAYVFPICSPHPRPMRLSECSLRSLTLEMYNNQEKCKITLREGADISVPEVSSAFGSRRRSPATILRYTRNRPHETLCNPLFAPAITPSYSHVVHSNRLPGHGSSSTNNNNVLITVANVPSSRPVSC
jgi:hypothetical protein